MIQQNFIFVPKNHCDARKTNMRLKLNDLQLNNKHCKGTTDPRVEYFNKVVTESASQLVTDMGRL